KELIEQVRKSPTPAAQYVAKYAEANYLWDELAAVAWLDPRIITKSRKLYIDVDTDHGAGYGNTLVWSPGHQPGLGEILVEVRTPSTKRNSIASTWTCSRARLPTRKTQKEQRTDETSNRFCRARLRPAMSSEGRRFAGVNPVSAR